MSSAQYPKAWYYLFAFVAAGTALAFLPYMLAEPTPPTFGPIGKSMQTELQAALRAAGAPLNQVWCYGGKGSRIISCEAKFAATLSLRSELRRAGWVDATSTEPSISIMRRNDLSLQLIEGQGSVNLSVHQQVQAK